MVTRSPFSASVSSAEVGEGSRRNGAMALETSKVSPSTKRFAVTLPSRYFAATSGRAGVRRGSGIAFTQELVDGARGLAFAAFGPRRFCRRCPAIDIDMQPAFGNLDEALQEQGAGDRTGKAAGWRIVDVGDFGIEPGIVRCPQR